MLYGKFSSILGGFSLSGSSLYIWRCRKSKSVAALSLDVSVRTAKSGSSSIRQSTRPHHLNVLLMHPLKFCVHPWRMLSVLLGLDPLIMGVMLLRTSGSVISAAMYCAYAVAARLCTPAGTAVISCRVVGAARQLGRSVKAMIMILCFFGIVSRLSMGIQSAFGDRSSSGDSLVIVETILGMWVQFMAGPVAKCVAREFFGIYYGWALLAHVYVYHSRCSVVSVTG